MGDERTYPLVYSTLSWTASARVRALTLKQIRITTDLIKQLLAFAPSPTLTANAGFDWWNSVGMLLTQLYNLSDSLLDGYREELDIRRLSAGAETEADASLRQAFLGARASALDPFRLVMTNQLAADDSEEESMSIVAGGTGRKQSLHRLAKGHLLKLAEKHMAFEVLIGICEDQGDRVRLEEYMRRYRTSGFVQQLFQWYLTNGNRSSTTRLCDLFPSQALCAHTLLVGVCGCVSRVALSRAGLLISSHLARQAKEAVEPLGRVQPRAGAVPTAAQESPVGARLGDGPVRHGGVGVVRPGRPGDALPRQEKGTHKFRVRTERVTCLPLFTNTWWYGSSSCRRFSVWPSCLRLLVRTMRTTLSRRRTSSSI